MSKKRVHIRTAVNAANVSKDGDTYTIRDVCGAVDDIVMNGTLYPADQLAAGAPTLEGKPAPAGHPKNRKGQNISALNGEALASAWIGSYCTNARHEGGRTLVDIVVNGGQAKAHQVGAKLIERLDAAISAANSDPIHVSTGLYHTAITANGESGGKKYSRIATNLQYDHLAILVDGIGAGTPAEGVGMFLNEAGEPEEVTEFTLNTEPEDKRSTGLIASLKAHVLRLLGNSKDVSFDAIYEGLRVALPQGAWIREVFDRYAIWTDEAGKLWRQDYSISSDGSVAFSSNPVEVTRRVEYQPVTNEEGDTLKEHILAALNAAGIATAGLDDTQALAAYNTLVTKPATEALNAANSKIAGFETNARAAEEAEVTALATELAVNSSLTVDDLKKLGLARLKELKGTAKAAPVIVGNATTPPAGALTPYDLNTLK